MKWSVVCSDAVAFLASLPDSSVDAVISDPPYPEIDRPYGRLTEAEWHALMRAVVAECRRILKPRGSAVFILQPNSERVGRMRPWLWEFMAWTAREWNQVQDAWWWNHATLPVAGANEHGLLRPSVKPCVWLGAGDCFRDQGRVLWGAAEGSIAEAALKRSGVENHPSGLQVDRSAMYRALERRGGVTPFNLIPVARGRSEREGYLHGADDAHGATTPANLAAWWTRYIVPVGGHVVDPFVGSGTMGIAAVEHGATFAGADKLPEYVEIARRRIRLAAAQERLDFGGAA